MLRLGPYVKNKNKLTTYELYKVGVQEKSATKCVLLRNLPHYSSCMVPLGAPAVHRPVSY